MLVSLHLMPKLLASSFMVKLASTLAWCWKSQPFSPHRWSQDSLKVAKCQPGWGRGRGHRSAEGAQQQTRSKEPTASHVDTSVPEKTQVLPSM